VHFFLRDLGFVLVGAAPRLRRASHQTAPLLTRRRAVLVRIPGLSSPCVWARRGPPLQIVGGHLVTDAPLGVFLLGDLDSSVRAALATRQTYRLESISVVFGEPAYLGEGYIDSVTRRLVLAHAGISLGAADSRKHLADAFAAMAQPSFDEINTFFLSKAAHDALKVGRGGPPIPGPVRYAKTERRNSDPGEQA
jgi:hypothetical protein